MTTDYSTPWRPRTPGQRSPALASLRSLGGDDSTSASGSNPPEPHGHEHDDRCHPPIFDTMNYVTTDEDAPGAPFPWECGEHFCDACGDCLGCQWESSCGPPFDNSAPLPHVYATDEYPFAIPMDRWVVGPGGRPVPLGLHGQSVRKDARPRPGR